MFSQFTPDIEVSADRWEEEQAVLAGLAEINSVQDTFGFSFEEASEYVLESLKTELEGLKAGLASIGSFMEVFGFDEQEARSFLIEKIDADVREVREKLANVRKAIAA